MCNYKIATYKLSFDKGEDITAILNVHSRVGFIFPKAALEIIENATAITLHTRLDSFVYPAVSIDNECRRLLLAAQDITADDFDARCVSFLRYLINCAKYSGTDTHDLLFDELVAFVNESEHISELLRLEDDGGILLADPIFVNTLFILKFANKEHIEERIYSFMSLLYRSAIDYDAIVSSRWHTNIYEMLSMVIYHYAKLHGTETGRPHLIANVVALVFNHDDTLPNATDTLCHHLRRRLIEYKNIDIDCSIVGLLPTMQSLVSKLETAKKYDLSDYLISKFYVPVAKIKGMTLRRRFRYIYKKIKSGD